MVHNGGRVTLHPCRNIIHKRLSCSVQFGRFLHGSVQQPVLSERKTPTHVQGQLSSGGAASRLVVKCGCAGIDQETLASRTYKRALWPRSLNFGVVHTSHSPAKMLASQSEPSRSPVGAQSEERQSSSEIQSHGSPTWLVAYFPVMQLKVATI
jgi:hypothetical protein